MEKGASQKTRWALVSQAHGKQGEWGLRREVDTGTGLPVVSNSSRLGHVTFPSFWRRETCWEAEMVMEGTLCCKHSKSIQLSWPPFLDSLLALLSWFSLHIFVVAVAQACPTLCNSMDCSMPGFPVLHYFPEFAQTHVLEWEMPANHLILCHPLLLLPSIFPSIRVFSNESALCIRWPK